MKALWEKLGRYRWIALLAALAAAWLLLGAQSPSPTAATTEEARIAQVLSAIQGAGKVEVALYYEATASAFGESTAKSPVGAVVVAQGAEDLAVRLKLIRAMRALLGLSETAVDVFPMKEEQP